MSEIARAAKAHWGYPVHWLESWHEFATIQPEEIGTEEYFVALSNDGQPVGFCAVGGPTEWQLEHLWVLPEWHGRGIGRRLFHRAAVYVREWDGCWFDLRSDPHAEGFYRRVGAVRIGEVDATMDGVPRIMPVMRYVLF